MKFKHTLLVIIILVNIVSYNSLHLKREGEKKKFEGEKKIIESENKKDTTKEKNTKVKKVKVTSKDQDDSVDNTKFYMSDDDRDNFAESQATKASIPHTDPIQNALDKGLPISNKENIQDVSSNSDNKNSDDLSSTAINNEKTKSATTDAKLATTDTKSATTDAKSENTDAKSDTTKTADTSTAPSKIEDSKSTRSKSVDQKKQKSKSKVDKIIIKTANDKLSSKPLEARKTETKSKKYITFGEQGKSINMFNGYQIAGIVDDAPTDGKPVEKGPVKLFSSDTSNNPYLNSERDYSGLTVTTNINVSNDNDEDNFDEAIQEGINNKMKTGDYLSYKVSNSKPSLRKILK